MTKFTTVSIPSELAEKTKKRIDGTGFHSLSSYVTYLLRQVIVAAELREESKGFVKEDEEELKKRLSALGYI